MSDLSSDFSYLRGAASDINNVAADLSDIVSVAITASSVVEGLSSDFGGLMSAVAATSVGMRAAVDNVTPLAGAFRQLQTQTGAAQTANKSMIAGLAGFVGKVDLASIAVSLLIEYGDDLVRAFTAGGESVEKLRKKLDAIDEYQDFDIAVKIAGAEGLEKLKLELEQLMAQKAYLENMISFDEAIEHARAAMKDVGELDVIHDSNAGIAALNAAIDAKSKYELQQAKRIEAGELSLERDESTRLLTKYLGMSRDNAEELFKLNQKNFEIAKQNAKIAKQTNKETEGAAGSVEKAGIAWKGVAKASREIEKDLQSVEESYPKEYETHEWMYQAGQDLGDAIGNIDLSIGAFTMAADDAAKKLSQNNYGYSPWLSAGYFFNPYGGYGTDDKGTDDKGTESWSKVAGGLSDLQNALQYGGIEVRGLSSFAKAARSYDAYLNPPDGQDPKPADLYSAIGAAGVGVGQIVGGRVGSVISSTASMASAGASLGAALATGGGPWGAAIGTVIGLVSSIFGGGDDDERRARRDEARQQAFNAIQGMALEGGPLSAELMRRSGWNWRNLAGMRSTPDLLEEYGLSWSRRFMADYGVEGARDRQETVKAIDNLLLSIKSFTDSGFSQSLDKLNIKYEYLAQKSHTPAFAEQAKLTDLIQLVTGINADTVVGSVSSALSSAASNGENAGEVFMESFTREILDGIANTAISQMVTNTIMPILEGPLSQIAQSMTAGEEFDASALAEAVSLAKSAAASVAPAVQELYAAFDASGMWAEAMGDNLNAVSDELDTVVDKWTALIEEVTGVSASSVTSNIMSAISSMSDQGGDVGQAFVQNFMDSVMSGLQRYAVDQLVSTVIEPMMAPVMDRIANSISISDGIDEEGLSNALTQAEELAQNVAPFVEDLYAIFSGADMYKKATAAGNQTLDEQIAKAAEEAVRAATMELSAELDAALKKIAELEEKKTVQAASTMQNAAKDAADSLLSAAEALRDYRTDLLANNLGKALGYEQLLRSQKGLVSELAAEALVGTRDSRVAAMKDIPGALRNYLGTFESMTTDPLVYAREIAKASALVQGIEVEAGLTEQQETTEEVKQLREEVRQMTLTLAQHSAQTAQILKRWEMSGFETTPAS